jgi:hypothetical protein
MGNVRSDDDGDLAAPAPAYLEHVDRDIALRPLSVKINDHESGPAREQPGSAVFPALKYGVAEGDVRARVQQVGQVGSTGELAATATAEVNEAVLRRAQRKGLVHMAALCWMMFLIGWNDGTLGVCHFDLHFLVNPDCLLRSPCF